MKKVFLFLFILCFAHANAQEFHFAPKVGMNISNITSSELGSRVGLDVGFAAEVLFTPSFAVESGVYYSMQGAQKTFGDYLIDDMMFRDLKVSFDMDYINIPVLAKYYAYKGLNIFAGPQLSFNVKKKIKVGDFEADKAVEDMFKKFDIGLNAGVGYQFDMGLQLSASYTYGLIGLLDKGNIADFFGSNTEIEDGNGHNSVVRFNIGWRF